MSQKQNAILASIVAVALASANTNQDEHSSEFKKMKEPVDPKPHKHYSRLKGRDQRWR